MRYQEETAKLNRTAIQVVGELFGLSLPERRLVVCPFPDHEDTAPSFQVRGSGNRWVCYGCNRSGGAIDFVKTYNNIDFLQAKKWLLNQLSDQNTLLDSQAAKNWQGSANSFRQPLGASRIESLPDYEVYETLLQLAPLRESGLTYLTERGLTEETLTTFRVGQISRAHVLLNHLIRNFGYSRIEASGLLTKSSTKNNKRLIFQTNSLMFPFLEKSRVAYLQVRSLFESNVRGKWRNLNHRKKRVYNVDALLRKGSKRLAICEGVIDTLSAIELNYDAIGLMGVNTHLTVEQIRLLRRQQVYILFDWDLPGERAASRLQARLRRYGIASTRKRLPSGIVKDVNDYLVQVRKNK